jgi:L-lactate dehydrogenase (cytochrome)
MKAICASELIRHKSKQSCWLAIHGTVWDVTNFVQKHPGGANAILKVAGQDATEEYDMVHDKDLVAKTLDPSAKVGAIDKATIPKIAQKPQPEKETAGSPPLSSMINVNDF